MPAAALEERQEARADDADVRRGVRVVGAEADLEDDGGGAGFLHVGDEGEGFVVDGEGVEGVQFDDPLVGVFDLGEVNVPAEGGWVGGGLDLGEGLNFDH